MIFVDTSVWISFFRGNPRPIGEHLRGLLDDDAVALAAPVRLEILSGSRAADLGRLRRLLSALPVYHPTRAAWDQIEGWIGKAVEKGLRFGIGDLLIAAVASEQGGELWSLDSDFERLSRVANLRLHRF